MKRKFKYFVILFFLLVITIPFVVLGGRRIDVALIDFSVIENGKIIELNTSVMSSAGFTRKLKTKQKDENLYVTFYSTFGINNSLGAKSTFYIQLNSECNKIYFYEGLDEYKLILEKDKRTDIWTKVK